MKNYINTSKLAALLVAFSLSGFTYAQECSINVLVVYTDQAADSLNGNEQAVEEILSAVESMNNSLIYSEVNHSMNLVRTIRMTAFESGCFTNDLNDFQENALVSSLRDRYHADVAVVILTNDEFCGLPYLDDELADESTAYCAVNFSCLVNSFGLSHQVAHLYGCSHYVQPSDSRDDALYKNGHGYVWSYYEMSGFSTILGVYDDYFCEENGTDNEDNCNLIPYYSNPSISYQSVPLGFPNVNDNASVLNQNAEVVGSFKVVPSVQKNLIDTIQYFDIAVATALDTLETGTSYLIQGNSSVEFSAKDRITLNPGFSASEGVRFETILTEQNEQCGQ